MARLLLNLRHVPDDEADEVRALLRAHGIAFYETAPGPFQISVGGIWLRDGADHPEAKRLLAEYQRERGERMRAEHAAAVREGRAATFWSQLRDEPARILLAMLGIAFVLGLMALPVLLLRG